MKIWDGSLEGHLRKNKPSIFLYLVRGLGVFAIVAALHPGSRFLGAALFGIGFIFFDFMVYQIVLAVYRNRLNSRHSRAHE